MLAELIPLAACELGTGIFDRHLHAAPSGDD